MSEWRTMQSAPRDGTPILAWMHRAWFGAVESGTDTIYWTDHNGGGWVSMRSGTPAFWQPLPAPPGREPGQP